MRWLDPHVASTAGSDIITGFNVADVIDAGAGDDIVNAGNGNDTITGGTGNDTITGGVGNDTYYYARGDGNDTIDEVTTNAGTDDRLILEGINPSDVTLLRNGLDVTLVIAQSAPGAGDGGSVLLKVALDEYFGRGIDNIVFADGTIWTRAELRLALLAQASTAGSDIITGFNVADVIDAGAGDDIVNAGNGNDTITGGTGNDTISGGVGNDTYYYARGDGNDTIDDLGSSPDVNQLVLEGVAASEVIVVRNGDNAILMIGPGGADGRITIRGQFVASGKISSVRFDDGTTWTHTTIAAIAIPNDGSVVTHYGTDGDDTISGSSAADVLDGGLGNDLLKGLAGSDIYQWGAGYDNDTIGETSGAVDVDSVRLVAANRADVTLARTGDDLYVKINATGETLTVTDHFYSTTYGVEQILFADGTTWNREQIRQAAWYRGTSGNDTLNGTASNDTFDGGLGSDTLQGDAGSDVYLYKSGDGNDLIDDNVGSTADIDTLKFSDLNAADITLSREGRQLKVKINARGDIITIEDHFYSQTANWGIEKIQFADGSEWNLATINSNAWYRGTSGNDTLRGSASNDIFDGGLGNDTLQGDSGNDVYIYASGDGNDLVDDNVGSTTDIDTLKFSDLNAADITLSREGRQLRVTINATSEIITIADHFYSQTANWGIEKIQLADGSEWSLATINANAWIRGTAGNETLTGTGWNDTIFGDAGNDILTGGAGNDVFIFDLGFGKDTVTDFTAGAGSDDVITFDADVFADFASVLAAANQVGSDTLITFDANNTVTLKNVALSSLYQDDFHFVA